MILFAREALSAADFSLSIGPRKSRAKISETTTGPLDERERESNKAIQNGSLDDDAKAKAKVHEREGLSLVSTKREREKERATKPRDLSEEAASPREKKRNKKKRKESSRTDKTARAGDANL